MWIVESVRHWITSVNCHRKSRGALFLVVALACRWEEIEKKKKKLPSERPRRSKLTQLLNPRQRRQDPDTWCENKFGLKIAIFLMITCISRSAGKALILFEKMFIEHVEIFTSEICKVFLPEKSYKHPYIVNFSYNIIYWSQKEKICFNSFSKQQVKNTARSAWQCGQWFLPSCGTCGTKASVSAKTIYNMNPSTFLLATPLSVLNPVSLTFHWLEEGLLDLDDL